MLLPILELFCTVIRKKTSSLNRFLHTGKKNIILIGGPNVNAVTKMYFDENIESHPILFDKFSFLLGNCKFHRPGYGLIALLPFRSKAKNKSRLFGIVDCWYRLQWLEERIEACGAYNTPNDAITIFQPNTRLCCCWPRNTSKRTRRCRGFGILGNKLELRTMPLLMVSKVVCINKQEEIFINNL